MATNWPPARYAERMSHAPRAWPESKLHLVTTKGNGGCRLILDITDRELFLDLLNDVVGRFEWELFAWCQLGNHIHLVVRAEPEHLARGMQRLKFLYAAHFHRRHHTSGHLFKRPYDSRPIHTTEHLHRACGYTLRNAARHGFVDRAEDWEWSSLRTVAGLDPPPRPHLACLHFLRLLGLEPSVNNAPILRAYVRGTTGETAMIAG